ncbi:DUF4192 family protein [Microbacterium gorillae]|uniref:DUF4192 family protein n=1 Tax=Microbacterium gorillae TaxID=1231063 RepID=UPI0005904E87|nr:DUF4192 family protein [Microbacterium gorillae]
MTTIIRAASAADFLSLIPHLAGYTPRRSVVLVPFHDRRTVGLLRFDLPPARSDAFAATAIGTVCRIEDADAVAIVVYTDDALRDETGAPTGVDLIAALRGRAVACGLEIRDALVVARDGWRRDGAGPGDEGALTDIRQVRATLPAPVASQAAGTRLPRTGAQRRDAVRAALIALEDTLVVLQRGGHGRRGAVDGADPEALTALTALDETGVLWEELLEADPATIEPHRLALLLWSLALPGLRDVALAHWCHGPAAGRRAWDAQLQWEDDRTYPTEELFLAGEGPRPNPERLERALALVRHGAAATSGRYRAAALACAAWLSWALGRGTHADAYARGAQRCDANHGLARIVRDLATAGHLPAWAFLAPAE